MQPGDKNKRRGTDSSILFCRAVVNRRAQDDFSPRLCKLYKLLSFFSQSGGIDIFCAGAYNPAMVKLGGTGEEPEKGGETDAEISAAA